MYSMYKYFCDYKRHSPKKYYKNKFPRLISKIKILIRTLPGNVIAKLARELGRQSSFPLLFSNFKPLVLHTALQQITCCWPLFTPCSHPQVCSCIILLYLSLCPSSHSDWESHRRIIPLFFSSSNFRLLSIFLETYRGPFFFLSCRPQGLQRSIQQTQLHFLL